MEFRLLKANEIDCRIGSINKANTGMSLLLYKDARCDMAVLDETVGVENWQRTHQGINDNMFCTVSVWDKEKKAWIGKQDCGIESSKTDRSENYKKGEASDSFKRACVNFGIGRELYTSPFVWVTDCTIKDGKCDDKFVVTNIGYDGNRVINELTIVNIKTKAVVFKLTAKQEKLKNEKISDNDLTALENMIIDAGVDPSKILKEYNLKEFADMTLDDYYPCIRRLQKNIDGGK